jgi:hypothetical protein
MVKTVLLVIAAVVILAIAVILVVAATKPDTFRLARSIEVKAPPEKIAPFIEDFRKWSEWSPYEKMGPMERTFSGAERGKGAQYAWEGEKKVGSGSMEIIEVTPTRIVISLDFIKPFEAHNLAEFTMEPKGDDTVLTWTMSGPLTYFFKIVHTVFSMDNMVGKDFEVGLVNLKKLAEQ